MDWQPFFFFAIVGTLIVLAIGVAIGYFVATIKGASKDGNANEPRERTFRAPRTDTSMTTKYPREGWTVGRLDPGESVAFSTAGPARHAVEEDTQAISAVRTVRAAMPRERLLATPPAIDGVTLRSYLTHHATRRCPHEGADGRPLHAGTWPCVVEDMYAVALASPLKHYFSDLDDDGVIDLKGHFLSALVTVTHVGLSVDTANRLEAAHAHLGITGADYDTVVSVLLSAVSTYTTPEVLAHIGPQLDPTFAALRTRLVTA